MTDKWIETSCRILKSTERYGDLITEDAEVIRVKKGDFRIKELLVEIKEDAHVRVLTKEVSKDTILNVLDQIKLFQRLEKGEEDTLLFNGRAICSTITQENSANWWPPLKEAIAEYLVERI